MHFLSPRVFLATALLLLLLQGCVVPGYPYPYGTPPQGSYPPPTAFAPTGVVVPAAAVLPAPLPYAYAPQQIIVAPSFYEGRGYGYWYGNQYWPYRPNCGFWNGRYYNGYRWNGCRPDMNWGYNGTYNAHPYGHQGYGGTQR